MPYYLKELNDAIRSDPAAFTAECDEAFAKKVETAAKKIVEHSDESRIILLSGPSGSGKTTTALKIEERLEDHDQAMRIHKVLHGLPEPYKEVFSLRVFGQLSFAQIGEVFGKTANWACVTYHRAKSKIQEAIK